MRGVILIVLAATVWGIVVMSHYGVTFDSPALFYAGDRTWFGLSHHNAEALDLLGPEPSGGFHHDTVIIAPWAEPKDVLHYPALPGLVCAATDEAFHVRLGWLNFIDAHQLGLVLMHAFALLFYGIYATRVLGKRAGILATLMLATFPVALGHSFNNAKDWPCAQFYGVAVLAAATGILERRARPLLASGLWLGLAFSCKFNAIFALITLLVWTPVAYLTLFRRRKLTVGVVGAYLLAPYTACAFFFFAWPWLHHGDIREWWRNIAEYVTFMVNYGVIPERTKWTAYPLRCLFTMTPPIVLACAIGFALVGYRKGRRELAVWALLILWTALPLLRVAAPKANFYDGSRHFLEYVPALCAMAGAGAGGALGVAERLFERWRASFVVRLGALGAAAAALAVGLIWPIAEYHPYETAYFNVFVGGLGGAQRRALFQVDDNWRVGGSEGDYWYQSIRGALRAMTRIAKPDDRIGVDGPPFQPQLLANWTGKEPLETVGPAQATLLYAAPSPAVNWKHIHALEQERPVRFRVERGGGLIYEVFGARDGAVHALVSPHTRYDDLP